MVRTSDLLPLYFKAKVASDKWLPVPGFGEMYLGLSYDDLKWLYEEQIKDAQGSTSGREPSRDR
jgi:hypothetical protein